MTFCVLYSLLKAAGRTQGRPGPHHSALQEGYMRGRHFLDGPPPPPQEFYGPHPPPFPFGGGPLGRRVYAE